MWCCLIKGVSNINHFYQVSVDKVQYRGEVEPFGVFPYLSLSNLRVTMLTDVESMCKTLGKVTSALVFIMFHGVTLQRNMATLQTECRFDSFTTDTVSVSRFFQLPWVCEERQKQMREIRSYPRYRLNTIWESTRAPKKHCYTRRFIMGGGLNECPGSISISCINHRKERSIYFTADLTAEGAAM